MSTAVLIELGEGCARSIGMEPTCFKTHRDSDGLARVPLVPAFFHGPKEMHVAHLMHRPLIQVTFGSPIPTAELPFGKGTTIELTRQLQAAIGELRSIADFKQFAA